MIITKNQLIAFLFGLGATITVRVLGIIAISDIVSILFLPFLFSRKKMFGDKRFRNVLILLLLWMLSAIISDIVNKTAVIDALKGFFTLIPFFSCLLFSYWLLRKDINLMIPFLWGYTISFTLSAGLGIDAYYQESLIRDGASNVSELIQYNKIIIWIVSSFINGVFAIILFRKHPRLVALTVFIFSFIVLFNGSRSVFLINFLVSIILFLIIRNTKGLAWDGTLWQKKLKSNLTKFFIVMLLFLFVGKNIYEFGVLNGYLGEREKNKFEMEQQKTIGLLSSRGAILGAVLAVIDAPILGHGSFAKDNNGYELQSSILVGASDWEINQNKDYLGEDLIPTHSHIFQAWVYNGILGAVFWLYILIAVLLRFMKKYLFFYPKYVAYSLLSILSVVWVILFSPFQQKPFLSMTLIFFIVLMRKKDLSDRSN